MSYTMTFRINVIIWFLFGFLISCSQSSNENKSATNTDTSKRIFINNSINSVPNETNRVAKILPGNKQQKSNAVLNADSKNPYANADISVKIIPTLNNTFGYNIYINGKEMIHQPNIPCLQTNEGFKTESQAKMFADFVVSKIRKGEMPPTVGIEDLKKLKIIN
jgi:hypothetical protein